MFHVEHSIEILFVGDNVPRGTFERYIGTIGYSDISFLC